RRGGRRLFDGQRRVALSGPFRVTLGTQFTGPAVGHMSCRVRVPTQLPGSRRPESMSALGPPESCSTASREKRMPVPQAPTSSPMVVLVHGAWHGSWCWAKVVPLLEEQGLAVRTVDLPSTGPDVEALGNLDDDVTALTAALDENPG